MLFRKWYQKLLYYGFCLNQWVWFHGLAGVTFVSLFLSNFYNNWNLKIPLLSTIKEFTCKFPAISVTLIAILWEFIEFFVECKGKWETVEDIYGSREHYLYDSLGDILLPMILAGIVVWFIG